MAQKSIKNGKYAVKELPALRAKINREFLIRLQPKETAPRFSMGAGKGMQVVFFPR